MESIYTLPQMLLLYNEATPWNSKLNVTSPHQMHRGDKLECAIWHTQFKSGIDLHDSEWLWRTRLSVMDVGPYCKNPSRKNSVLPYHPERWSSLLDAWWRVLDLCLIPRDTYLCLYLAIGDVFTMAQGPNPIFKCHLPWVDLFYLVPGPPAVHLSSEI